MRINLSETDLDLLLEALSALLYSDACNTTNYMTTW
jgi:hypothetical protein